MIDILVACVVSAALTSLVIESPLGDWLRRTIAGAPTRKEWAAYREACREGRADEVAMPEATVPWLDDGMQCQMCVGFYTSLVGSFIGINGSLGSWLLLWGCAWIGGRLLLGAVRALESVPAD